MTSTMKAVVPPTLSGDGGGGVIVEHRHQPTTDNTRGAGGGRRRSRREVPIKSYRDVRPTLQQMINQVESPWIVMLEQKTGMDREKLLHIFLGVMALWLMVGPSNGLLCNIIGVAYPAYCSVQAVRSEEKDDDTHWLIYWCAYALVSMCDALAEPINRTLPLYWLAKALFMLYLAAPQTYGAYNIYVGYVDPLVDWLTPQLRKLGIGA